MYPVNCPRPLLLGTVADARNLNTHQLLEQTSEAWAADRISATDSKAACAVTCRIHITCTMHILTQLFSETGLNHQMCMHADANSAASGGKDTSCSLSPQANRTKAQALAGAGGPEDRLGLELYACLEILQPTKLTVAANKQRPTRPKVCCLANVGGGGSPYTVVTGDNGSSCQLSPVASWAPSSGKCTRGS